MADAGSCCRAADTCAFDKALRARTAHCALAHRACEADGDRIACRSPVALLNCTTLVALLRERSTFALKLPSPSRGPLVHAQAIRLQCGGVEALRHAVDESRSDVHELVVEAHERFGSLTELPWAAIVAAVASWEPRRRLR